MNIFQLFFFKIITENIDRDPMDRIRVIIKIQQKFMPINLKTHIRFHKPLKNLTESFQGQALLTLHGTLFSSMNNFPRHITWLILNFTPLY